MSGDAAIIATTLKEAERLAAKVRGQLLPKLKVERMDFDQEDLDAAYQILDRLALLNETASCSSHIAIVQMRIEQAEEALAAHMSRMTFMPAATNGHFVKSLEGFHEVRRQG